MYRFTTDDFEGLDDAFQRASRPPSRKPEVWIRARLADIELELEREADAAAAEDPSFLSLDNPVVVALLSLALLSAVAALRG